MVHLGRRLTGEMKWAAQKKKERRGPALQKKRVRLRAESGLSCVEKGLYSSEKKDRFVRGKGKRGASLKAAKGTVMTAGEVRGSTREAPLTPPRGKGNALYLIFHVKRTEALAYYPPKKKRTTNTIHAGKKRGGKDALAVVTPARELREKRRRPSF